MGLTQTIVVNMKLTKTVIAALALGAVATQGLHLRGNNSSDVTMGPKFSVVSTNYMDVDPQDTDIKHQAEAKQNATLEANLKKIMVEDRRANCAGTGRDCLTDNPSTVDQDNKVEDGPVQKETEPSTKDEGNQDRNKRRI